MTKDEIITNAETEIEKNRQREIFSGNLNRLLQDRQKTQLEVAKDINVAPQTFNSWVKGGAIPRMRKVQRLADYFHVEKSALLDEPREAITFYKVFKDQKDAELVEKIINNRSLANLVETLYQLPDEKVDAAAKMISILASSPNNK